MLTLYNKDFTTKYGTINTAIEAFVEEERNGLFELSFIMLNTDSLFNYVKEDNIVVANANDTLLNQKFRIYMTRKLMNNRVEVFARHISFDLMYDYIDNISFENQSCEYALNMLFRNSNFSKHYKGYSDIINAQDYSMSMANILEAIGGKEGSILDTFGTGAELLRDNENIHVLNKRGHDNSVSIEYKKNLTGFELEEDTTELITRILPYAKYTPKDSEGNSQDEVIVKANYVDSPLIANYSHPFIKAIDYSDKFNDENIPTVDKLKTLAGLEYKNNKVDMPKQNFKIEFIPLSKCVGYEGLRDNISLCDTVIIKDTRYNINTQAKVIKVTYNVLKNRYESVELGEPKTSLTDIVGNNDNSKGEKGDKGDKGEPGKDGSIGDFPNSLPSTPAVTTKAYGFANIEISWTFENKAYYQYEVYASKEADFIPNTFNLIHQGQTSTYMYQAKPNETWYFKVCCVNSHGERTDFGNAYATTAKIDDLSNYVGEMAIGDALIDKLNLGRGWVGELKGNYIDAKNLSVTDGNGKRTLDIDSFGNVNLDVASLKINNTNVETEISGLTERIREAEQQITSEAIINTVSRSYYKKDETDNILRSNSHYNLLPNSTGIYGTEYWFGAVSTGMTSANVFNPNGAHLTCVNSSTTETSAMSYKFTVKPNTTYTISYYARSRGCETVGAEIYLLLYDTKANDNPTDARGYTSYHQLGSTSKNDEVWRKFTKTIRTGSTHQSAIIRLDNNGSVTNGVTSYADFIDISIYEGEISKPWTPSPKDTDEKIAKAQSQLTQTAESFEYKFNKECNNLVYNSTGKSKDLRPWEVYRYSNGSTANADCINGQWSNYEDALQIRVYHEGSTDVGISQKIKVIPNKVHTLCCYIAGHRSNKQVLIVNSANTKVIAESNIYGALQGGSTGEWKKVVIKFTPTESEVWLRLKIGTGLAESVAKGAYMWVKNLYVVEGDFPNLEWRPHNSEFMNNITNITADGVIVNHLNDGSYSKMSSSGFEYYVGSTGNRYHNLMVMGEYECLSEETKRIYLPSEFKGKPFRVITSVKRVSANYDLYKYKAPLLSFYAHADTVNHAEGWIDIYASVRGWNYNENMGSNRGQIIGDESADNTLLKPVVAYWVIA